MASVRIRRIGQGPAIVIEDAEALVAHFLRHDASAQPGGYDDLAGHGERDRITRSDIVAINTTMRARSPQTVWDALTQDLRPLPWLAGLDPAWDLVTDGDEHWSTTAGGTVEQALKEATGPGRGISVGSKVLHLKRPAMFPVLDSLVLQQLGATESGAEAARTCQPPARYLFISSSFGPSPETTRISNAQRYPLPKSLS